jgi:hypothetical protein
VTHTKPRQAVDAPGVRSKAQLAGEALVEGERVAGFVLVPIADLERASDVEATGEFVEKDGVKYAVCKQT